MQHSSEGTQPAFVVEFHGLKVHCDTMEHVVTAVKALAPLEREVPVPMRTDREVAVPEPISIVGASPIATAVYDLYREEPRWRRPVEIVKALKKRGVRTKYPNVYAVLRYGDFVKREGRWNTKDAQAAF